MNPRILVVDDEEPIRTVIEAYLSSEDLIIDVSDDMKGALSLLELNRYDIRTCPVRMAWGREEWNF